MNYIIDKEQIAELAVLYDQFVHALDPFSRDRDRAEMLFNHEAAQVYDSISIPKPPFPEFRRYLLMQCRKHLRASDKPPSV